MSDDDMTAEEFDRRLAEATPVDVTVNLGRTYTRTVAAQPAPVPSDPDVTPSLDDFLHDYEADTNIWWTLSCGHHLNLFEAAVERAAEVKSEGAKRAIDEIDSWMSTADDGLYDEWVSKRGAVRAANGVAS